MRSFEIYCKNGIKNKRNFYNQGLLVMQNYSTELRTAYYIWNSYDSKDLFLKVELNNFTSTIFTL